MTSNYELILTKEAVDDLDSIYKYISETLIEKEVAKKIINEIESKILILKEIPEGFNVIKHRKNIEYRRLLVKNFVVIYRVDKRNNKIFVNKIINGRTDYLEII